MIAVKCAVLAVVATMCLASSKHLGSVTDDFNGFLRQVPTRKHGTSPLPYRGMTFTNERYCPNVTLGSKTAADSLAHLATTGANSVSVVVTRYQDNHRSTSIYSVAEPTRCTTTPNGWCLTATDSDVEAAIQNARKVGIRKVMLKLQIDLMNDEGKWRGDIGIGMDEAEWAAWFDTYTKSILHYAAIAQRLKVEMLSVSCELVVASMRADQWRSVIKKIRRVYHGILVDSANWSPPGGHGEVTDKTWWDAVDIIGVDQYYVAFSYQHLQPDGKYRTVDDLVQIWQPIVQQLDELHTKFNKSVLFTEIGYCAGKNGTCFMNMPERDLPEVRTSAASLQAQADQYEAVMRAMSPHRWFLGVFWWNWATDAAFGGDRNSCMDPKFKPSEAVLRRWYGATMPAPPPPSYPPQCRCWL